MVQNTENVDEKKNSLRHFCTPVSLSVGLLLNQSSLRRNTSIVSNDSKCTYMYLKYISEINESIYIHDTEWQQFIEDSDRLNETWELSLSVGHSWEEGHVSYLNSHWTSWSFKNIFKRGGLGIYTINFFHLTSGRVGRENTFALNHPRLK